MTAMIVIFHGNTAKTVHEVNTVAITFTFTEWFILANNALQSVAITFGALIVFSPFFTNWSVSSIWSFSVTSAFRTAFTFDFWNGNHWPSTFNTVNWFTVGFSFDAHASFAVSFPSLTVFVPSRSAGNFVFDDTEVWLATFINWTFIVFSTFDNLLDLAFWAFSFTFAPEDWALLFIQSFVASKFFTFSTGWSWSWFTNSRFTSTLVFNFYNHFARPTVSYLDSWTKSVDTDLFSRATAFSTFDKTDSFLNLAFVTFDFFNLWTVKFFFSTAFTW
jgi:hypothetical protein